MPQTYGPCAVWDPIYCCTWPTGATVAVTGYALEAATEILWAESGRQFGLCERTIRPCRRDCFDRGGWYEWASGVTTDMWPRPYLYQGNWFNLTCGSCPGSCSCVGLEEAVLPGPVYAVTQVLLNGSIMASGSYRVDEDRILVRTDGGMWPFCQDMTQDDDGVDAWAVTAQFGVPVPVSGRQAVGELACEIARACLGQECRLPANVQTAARQGVTIEFGDPNDIAQRLYFVGLFIHAYNPRRYSIGPRVFDVDGPGYRRTNTTAY